ncbi:MAG: CRISPR-associated helicase Cas3' [Bradyrhizobium sp.]|uniref:CRISPR-associated helicase Cas3' n=1 Tax=Bradyrhizobium sp. TaxID=376 RepID=UPI0027239C65|nr:CRISPR-associated helicase Cas3' [Bradyrhizobium sp.]MDO8399352.1 CRISPR-associated helicase Cas3' [Bradyrhizobium sp.]
MHYAHSTATAGGSNWQPLQGHLRQTALRARSFGGKFGAAKAAALAGWLHDLGKYSQAYQAYIAGRGPGGVDHSTAGAQQIMKLSLKGRDQGIAELIAYAIAGHHAGLPDMTGADGEVSALADRLKKSIPALDPVWQSEIEADLSGLFPAGIKPVPNMGAFQIAFLGRMIFSCLVDADFLDTEAFYAAVDGRQIDRTWPVLADEIERMIASLNAHMVEKRRTSLDSPLNRLRGEIMSHVRQKAGLPRGVFTLNVPTGGGKTLASLAFALDHASHWKLERIIYAIPFTSIIEQTASIFREILGDESILEHHSSIEPETARKEELLREQQSDAKLRLATENWQAPLIVTTNVQLFESLFANRTSRCRKLHNLANAVIILDEAQTIPLHVLRPCVAALDELARNYGCTIVLCTATQPALQEPRFPGGFEIGPERELAPDPAMLHRELRRTTERIAGVLTDDDLVAEMSGVDQGLTIVNSRRHALELYQLAKSTGLDGLIHLTTRQTAFDRRSILHDVRERLNHRQPCLVIATSLVEAGVDVDFPRVWRAEAGLDQLTQAAGRCNREGRRPVEESVVTFFKPAEARPPAEIKGLIGDMLRILGQHRGDLFSPQAIEAYFSEVYWRKSEQGLDKQAVMKQFRIAATGTDFAYRSVAERFRLIETGMEPVIVATDEEPQGILRALRGGMPPGLGARKLQNHLVQVPPKDRGKLIENGHVQFVDGFGDQFAVLMTADLYSREIGLIWEKADELGFDGII